MMRLIENFKKEYELLDDHKNIDMKGNNLRGNDHFDNQVYHEMKNIYIQPLLHEGGNVVFHYFNTLQGRVYANFKNGLKIELDDTMNGQDVINAYKNAPVH